MNKETELSCSPTGCLTAICPLCQCVSWTGDADNKYDIEEVMNKYPQKDWCTCGHILSNTNLEYPPKAGTGDRRSSLSSFSS